MKQLAVWLTYAVIRLIGATLRMTLDDQGGILNQPAHPPVIIAFWHNRTALMASFYQRYCYGRTALTFISRSRDGELFLTSRQDGMIRMLVPDDGGPATSAKR